MPKKAPTLVSHQNHLLAIEYAPLNYPDIHASGGSSPDLNPQVDSIIYATGFDLLASGYGFQVGWDSVFRLGYRYVGFWFHVGFPFS